MNVRKLFLSSIMALLLFLFITYTIYMNRISQHHVHINQPGPTQRGETKQRENIKRVMEQLKNSISKEVHLLGECKLSFNCTKGSNPPFKPNMMNVTFADLRLMFPEMKRGGWSPEDCDPGLKVAIIIPYRDREEHLKILLVNIIPFLKIQKKAFTIFVIEQAGNALFNRATLMNIGYIESLKLDSYTCFIFHDVDMVPIRLCNFYECYKDKAMHLGVSRNKDPPRVNYPKYVGGVLSLHKQQMDQINGFTNLMFGWGKEDDEIFLRLKGEDITVSHRTPAIGNYVMPIHKRDDSNPLAHRNYQQTIENVKYRKVDGLSSLNYTFKEIVQDPLYTKIVVDIEGPKLKGNIKSYYTNELKKVKQRLASKS